jgi:tetraacyldisaccharide 4'-kinase
VPFQHFLQNLWYGNQPLSMALMPAAWVYAGLAVLRRQSYVSGLLRQHRVAAPVVMVGNLSVGGTGKTPLVIWIYKFLLASGYKPGIISRGYRGRATHWPQQVRPDSDPATVGDEAVVIARHCRGPMAVGPDRRAAAEALIRHHGCDVIVSDDGLQHYPLWRDVEIAVIDGVRRHGNGRCLPAGPLREPHARLGAVDMVVTNGIAGRGEFSMKYLPQPLRPLREPGGAGTPKVTEVHGVAGIGNPESFFNLLRAQGYRVHKHRFPDHHAFRRQDIEFNDGLPVVMTEKDAVKCERFAGPLHYCLPIEAELPPVFGHRLLELLRRNQHGQKTA